MLMAPLLVGPRRRLPVLLASVFVALAAVLAVLALAPGTATERLHSSDQTGSGRTDLWRVALRMSADKPVLGAGAGNFRVSSIHYLLRPGALTRDEAIVDHPKVTHNIYLQTLAELGIIGIAMMLGIILLCLRAALHAARAFTAAGDRGGEILARAVAIAMIGLLAADFFSSQLYAQQLWLGLALCPALYCMARRAGAIH
jgi:O-antigen ligase